MEEEVAMAGVETDAEITSEMADLLVQIGAIMVETVHVRTEFQHEQFMY